MTTCSGAGRIESDKSWHFEHAGGGPLTARLKAKAEKLGIAERVTWHGAQERSFIFKLLERADLFVLPSRLTASGDRDGIPNVLMEAQAFRVPVVSTDISGIPELVTHGETGWLVPQKDPRALGEALRTLLGDADLRNRIAAAGATRVRRDFSSEPGIDFVAKLLRDSVARQVAA
jgi:glycosyltransferase involved in cell wall biosynthesis